MKKLVIGILAHVDAGKTTLSEALLYLSGKTRKLGRVDKQDAYLDTHELERQRGITIFSKQAIFQVDDVQITLLDTPGHVDFSAEMERTLQVLDYAILVISAADGVQGHTLTLWRLLERYRIPTFIFINKMDQDGAECDQILADLKSKLSEGCCDFGASSSDEFYEQIAMCDEELLEIYLEKNRLELAEIQKAVKRRSVFPCRFGSALKLEGVEEFLHGIVKYAVVPSYPEEFGARVFKITRDEQGARLTHMKITGGSLKIREAVTNGVWEEKVNQIRLYSGEKYEAVSEAAAGTVCAVMGLTQTKPGEGLGSEQGGDAPVLEPVLSYQIILPPGVDPKAVMPKFKELEEETPELSILWNEELQEIQVRIMGEVQIEILQRLIQDRFNLKVEFDTGKILYKETIADVVEGVGHFEPLGHYAEVHLLLEPGSPGSGVVFASNCSEDELSRSWQNLVLTHLREKVHKGVLTGSPVTDLKITLVAGRAHVKHTEGGDFREATHRAVRQGLMEAKSVLLEPYYAFHLEIPEQMIGRAMTDIDQMHGTCRISDTYGDLAVLTGYAPVVTMRNYHREVTAYTRGRGRLFCSVAGYRPCHNADEVIAAIGYDAEQDLENPTGSIFYANGAGFYVPWDQVKQYMHLESWLKRGDGGTTELPKIYKPESVDFDELDHDYYEQAVYANKRREKIWVRKRKPLAKSGSKPAVFKREVKEHYLLVDGYNIIHAWPEVKELAEDNMDGARLKLMDVLCSYQAVRQCEVIVVFDAYKVPGGRERIGDYNNIKVVFTKEAQTADEYIERFAYEHQKKYRITVATSDTLEQLIIRGAGSTVWSAEDLLREVNYAAEQTRRLGEQSMVRNYLGDSVTPETREQMNNLKEGQTPK
ncbi:MAG TPA: GTP-binding protein [Firmicutes bacterium]|nr:GTP-binding protein [Bacillota bacterium]